MRDYGCDGLGGTMKLKLEHADIIKQIIRIDGKAEILVRVSCPFCRVNRALLLIGKGGRYECQACHKSGKLTDLIVYFEDVFEHKHRRTMRIMQERDAVDL